MYFYLVVITESCIFVSYKNKETMTNEQKIQAEFEALMNQGKTEAKSILAKAAQEAKNAPKIERKRPTLVRYTIEDVTPAGYGI